MTRRKGPSDGTRDVLDVVGSDLLDFGQLIIAGMKMTTGEGEPDPGSSFRDGREGFDKARDTLRSAVPDDRWGGGGSRAYADQNTRQQLRSEAMADADEAVFSVLVRESLQIKARRDTLDTQSDLLAKTSYATFPLQFVPRYGEAAKLAIETAALNAALQLCAFTLYGLHSEVSDNANELRQAVGRYAGVADGADPPTEVVDFNPPPTPVDGRPSTPPPDGPPAPIAGGGGPFGGGSGGSGAMPGPAPQLDLPEPDLPAELPAIAPASASVPQAPMTGMPAPGAAGGAVASIVAPLAGLVTGIALAAGQAASAGEPVQVEADDAKKGQEDQEGTVTAEDVRDGDPGDQVDAAGPGQGTAERAPVGAESDPHSSAPNAAAADSVSPGAWPAPSNGRSPQDEKLGEGAHVGR